MAFRAVAAEGLGPGRVAKPLAARDAASKAPLPHATSGDATEALRPLLFEAPPTAGRTGRKPGWSSSTCNACGDAACRWAQTAARRVIAPVATSSMSSAIVACPVIVNGSSRALLEYFSSSEGFTVWASTCPMVQLPKLRSAISS